MNCFIIVLKEQWECAIVNDSVWNEKFCFVSAQRLAINSSQRIKYYCDNGKCDVDLMKNQMRNNENNEKKLMSIQCTIAKFSVTDTSENRVYHETAENGTNKFLLPCWLRKQMRESIEFSAIKSRLTIKKDISHISKNLFHYVDHRIEPWVCEE